MKIFREKNQTALIIIFILLSLVRIFGDIFFIGILSLPETVEYIWKTLTALAIITSFTYYIFHHILNEQTNESEESVNEFFKDLTRWMILSLIFLIILAIIPIFVGNDSEKTHGYITYIPIILLIPGIFSVYFIIKWLLIRRHKKTRIYIRVLLIVLFISLFFNHLAGLIGIYSLKSLAQTFLFISIIISYLATKRNSWLVIIPRKDKMHLLWQSFFGMFCSIIFITFLLNNDNAFNYVMNNFAYGANAVVVAPYYFAIGYFFRLFFATLMSLPTSQVLELQNYEIRSLSYINSIVADSVNIDKLLSTVLDAAQYSSEANCSWIELYPNKSNDEIIFTKNISKDAINQIYKQGTLKKYFKDLNKSLLIPSIPEGAKNFNNDLLYIFFGKSLIAVPLKANNEKIGMLFVLHIDEYWFELNKVYVLEAFCNQVSIALVNAQLLHDSLEKERYRKELLLAKEMEEKLLPQKLPKFNNYTISAFSLPAIVVGGDYYDIVILKNNNPCILIGDVSGKGMSAAFYMALLKGVVLAVASESTGASDILRRINSTLFGAMEKHTYITLAALVLENSQGDITYSRAGHIPAILKINNEIVTATPKGLGVGLAQKNTFDLVLEEQHFKLNNNDACVLFTDGLTELNNENNEEFGYEHLKQILSSGVLKNSEDLIEEIKDELNNFSRKEIEHDDLTIITIVFND